MIRAIVGRRVLFALILCALVLSFSVLAVIGRGGAISHGTAIHVVKRLIEFYAPLVGVLAGFYFSELGSSNGKTTHATSIEAFALATCLVGAWVSLPPLLLAVVDTVEGALRFLDTVAIVGALAMGALAFYFSKSSTTTERT
jgi:hypothetical protein